MDELSFLRVMRLLPGVGEKSAANYWNKLGRQFDGNRKEDRDALFGLLGVKGKKVWPQLAKCFEVAQDHIRENEIGELLEDFTDLFYEDHLREEWEDAEAEERLADIKELSAQIAASETGLEGFLQDVALLTNLDAKRNNSDSDRLTLSTVHQAKGMEWPVVVLPWLSEGMFPSAKATEEGRLDEERRLFYVAVTRAKDHLCMFAPEVRRTADGGMFPVNVSAFAKEIPRDLIEASRIASYPEEYSHSRPPRQYPSGGATYRSWRR
jgi:DNA helicase-2/ATP-dependent DNA helicase PcrA